MHLTLARLPEAKATRTGCMFAWTSQSIRPQLLGSGGQYSDRHQAKKVDIPELDVLFGVETCG